MSKKVMLISCTLLLASMGIFGCSNSQPAAPIEPISEEVSWNIGETTVSATVTYPGDSKRHPAIIFVAGSGPTDRDWNSPLLPGTNGSARLLANELAKAGYVTIRYDKRIVGVNAEKNLPLLIGKISMESHVEEIAGAVSNLLSRSDVDPKRIYVLANSEGTIHALNYQIEREPKFKGLILVAPPGRPMAEVMRAQIKAQVSALPNSDEIMAGYDRLMADFLAGKPYTADKSLPEGINNLVLSLHTPANLPFARELFTADPPALLVKIEVPVLVVIGKKDVQVDWELDGDPLQKATENQTNVGFVFPETANHVLKYEAKARAELTGADVLYYNASDKVIDSDALKIIKDWLVKND